MRINGEALRTIRMIKGMTVYDLASAVGVTVAYISLIERGRRPFPEKHAHRFLEALGVSVDDVLETERLINRLKGGETK